MPIVFILALKRPKNCIFGSEFWSRRRQKCYRDPFLGHFETPKEYGRHCHRYLGKVKFFRDIWITKRCQKRDFCSGGALKAPPLMVGLMNVTLIIIKIKFIVIIIIRCHCYIIMIIIIIMIAVIIMIIRFIMVIMII